jgi:hypothetical protein
MPNNSDKESFIGDYRGRGVRIGRVFDLLRFRPVPTAAGQELQGEFGFGFDHNLAISGNRTEGMSANHLNAGDLELGLGRTHSFCEIRIQLSLRSFVGAFAAGQPFGAGARLNAGIAAGRLEEIAAQQGFDDFLLAFWGQLRRLTDATGAGRHDSILVRPAAAGKINREEAGCFYRLIHGYTYSFARSPSGRRRPLCGCRIQPSGSPWPSHTSIAATAAAGVSYHHSSQTST